MTFDRELHKINQSSVPFQFVSFDNGEYMFKACSLTLSSFDNVFVDSEEDIPSKIIEWDNCIIPEIGQKHTNTKAHKYKSPQNRKASTDRLSN